MHLTDVRRIADSGLKGSEKQSLVAIALFASDAGSCYPSMASIARRAGLDPKTARKAVARLVEAGLLTTDERGGRSTVFQIHLDGLPEEASTPTRSGTPTKTGTPTTLGSGTPTRSGSTPLPDLVPEPVIEPVKEPVRIEAPPRPATAEGLRWLQLLERWSGVEAPTDRRWQVKPDDDLAWFTSQVLPSVAKGVDISAQLDRIDCWLEGEARKTSKSKFWKTIGGAKNGTKRWLLNAKGSPVNGHTHKAADPAAAGEAWASISRLNGPFGPKFVDEAPDNLLPHREAMRAGLSAIGGIRAWGSMSDRDRHFARPAFVKAFEREQGATP